eukprot:gene10564-biopygen10836
MGWGVGRCISSTLILFVPPGHNECSCRCVEAAFAGRSFDTDCLTQAPDTLYFAPSMRWPPLAHARGRGARLTRTDGDGCRGGSRRPVERRGNLGQQGRVPCSPACTESWGKLTVRQTVHSRNAGE